MANKRVRTNIDGRDYVVNVPVDADESEYEYGLIVGPPEALVDVLLAEWDLSTVVNKLHQELYARDIITLHDATRRKQDVASALQAVLKLDVERIIRIYQGSVTTNGNK